MFGVSCTAAPSCAAVQIQSVAFNLFNVAVQIQLLFCKALQLFLQDYAHDFQPFSVFIHKKTY